MFSRVFTLWLLYVIGSYTDISILRLVFKLKLTNDRQYVF